MPSSLGEGTDSGVVTPVILRALARAHTQAFTRPCTKTKTQTQGCAHTHIDTNKKRHGWMSGHTRPKLTQTKTSSNTNLEYI